MTVVSEVDATSASSEIVIAATPPGSASTAFATRCSAGASAGITARTRTSSGPAGSGEVVEVISPPYGGWAPSGVTDAKVSNLQRQMIPAFAHRRAPGH